MKHLVHQLAVAIALVGCSAEQPPGPQNESRDSAVSANAIDTVTLNGSAAAEHRPAHQAAFNSVLSLEGLRTLRIGQAIPAGSTWAERGGQASDTCRIVTSPDFPGIYAIVERGRVRRITVGQRSTVRLAEGIGVGSTEKEVLDWFGGFRAEPHEYVTAPAKYLTAPNAASGDPALRFEIGADGKVSHIHVGTMPVLGYVEGCA